MRRNCALQCSVRWKSSATGVWGLDSPMYGLTDKKVTDRVVLFHWFWVCHLQTACSHLNSSTCPFMLTYKLQTSVSNVLHLNYLSVYTQIIFKLSDGTKYTWPCNMLSLHLIVPWLVWEWRNLLSNIDHHRWSVICWALSCLLSGAKLCVYICVRVCLVHTLAQSN